MTQLPLVLQLDAAGNPIAWCSIEKTAYYYSKDLIAWEGSPETFTIYGGMSRITGRRSFLTMNTIIATKGKINQRQIDKSHRVPLSNNSLFRRDRQVCAYCGNPFHLHELSRDHIIPQSKGGPNNWMNVVTACKPCNKKKSDHLLEDIDMQLLYLPYVPNKSEYLILQNRRILGDQLDFLLKRVPKESRLNT